jgi:putative oxidoreductase
MLAPHAIEPLHRPRAGAPAAGREASDPLPQWRARMKGTTDPWTSLGLLILRLGTGFLMIYGHGWGKVMRFQDRLHTFSDPIGLGSEVSFVLVVFAEVVCAALVALGLWTRAAAVPIVIFAIVAIFFQHWGDPFGKKELPALYGVAALTLVLTGGGLFSLEAVFGKKRGG